MAVLVQVLATIIVCFPCLNFGILSALPSSTIADFTSPDTKLHRPMTEMEVNLYGSMASLGGMVGAPAVAFLMDRIGRKQCSVLAGLAGVVSWGILASTSRIELVLTAVFIGGLSGISFLIVPSYCSEFCQESIRGTVTAGSMVFLGMGTLVSYLLGGFLEYRSIVYVALAMAVVQLVLMGWLKESPTVLMTKGLEEQAADSIAFYRQVKIDSKVVMQELAIFRRALKPDESELIPEVDNLELGSEKKLSDKTRIVSKKSLWQYIKTSQPTQRGFIISLVLMSAAVFQGILVVQVYAEPIFVEAVPEMAPTTCTLSLAVAIVVASVFSAYMSDLAGRRPLIIYSSIASSICCVLLGTQIQFHWAPSWLTAVLIYVFSIVYSFGGGTVPFVLVAEVFLPEVKNFMTMIVVEWMWLCYFLALLVFYPLAAVVGLGGVFHVFAAMCLLTAVFSVFYVPETKGLTLDEVQILLVEKRNS